MKKLFIVWMVLIMASFATVSFASNVSIAANEINVSETVTKLTGNIVITFDKNKDMEVNAVNFIKKGNELLLEGNVEIKYGNLIIHAEKASILTINDTVKIKLDSCEVIYA